MTKTMNQQTKSLKNKVFQVFALMTLCFSVAYSTVCLIIAYTVEDDVIQRLMLDEVQYLTELNQQNKPLIPRLDNMAFYADFAQIPAHFQAAMPQMSDDGELFSDDDQHWHLLPMTLNENTTSYLFLEASRYLVVQQFSDDLVLFISLLFGLTLACALVCTYLVTRKTVSPIVNLANSVAKHKTTASVAFAQATLNDEVGVLARTIEQSFNQLSQALQREADFTRDLGHELRTPLAIIKNYLTLQDNRSLTLAERQDMAWQVVQMQERMNILMALARAETVVKQPVHLRASIEQCLLLMSEHYDIASFDIDINVDYQLVIESNPTMLTMLLTNLIENALKYAVKPQLLICADSCGISISNPVDAVPENIMAKHVKHEQSLGIGQGLYLVARIADSLGWQYHTEMIDSRFIITFKY